MLTLWDMKQEHSDRELLKFRAQLKRSGLKVTAQRLAVHKAMMSLGHASAETVRDWIATGTTTKITVASVYNILSQMASLGIYSQRTSTDSRMYFDCNTLPHMHMYDYENHVFRDIPDEELYREIMQRLGKRRFRGYRLEGVDIQFLVHPITRRRP